MMPDLAALLGGIQAATEIAKALRRADLSLETAELKFQMAEIVEALAEAKMAAAEVQEILQGKDKEIRELKRALELKETVTRFQEAYYEKDESGKPKGDPYCSHCWEGSNRLIHLHTTARARECPLCKTEYSKRRTPIQSELTPGDHEG